MARSDEPSGHEHFGEHVTVDGYGGNPIKLNDPALVEHGLRTLCVQLNMTPLSEPMVVYAPGTGGKDPGGWSGFIMLSESHISIHTFPARRFLSADAYTCRNGVIESDVVTSLQKIFCLEDFETHLIRRGLKYPIRDIVE